MSTAQNPGLLRHTLRRGRKLAIWTIVILVALRLLLPLVLPYALDRLLAGRGLTATYERLDLTLLGGAFSLHDLEVFARDASGSPTGERLVRLEHVAFDLDVTALLSREVRVRTATLDGLHLLVERTADGKLAWAKHLPELAALANPAQAVPDAGPEPGRSPETDTAFDLRPPLTILFARCQNLRVVLRDLAEPRPQERVRELLLSARLSDLGVAGRTAVCDVTAHLDPKGGTTVVRIRAETAERSLHLAGDLSLYGLCLDRLAGWLAPLGLEPDPVPIDGSAALRIDLEPESPTAKTCTGRLAGSIDLRSAGKVAAQLRTLAIPITRASSRHLELGTIALEGITMSAERRHDGSVAFLGLVPRPTAGRAEPKQSAPPPAAGATSRATNQPSAPFEFALGGLRLTDLALSLADPRLPPPGRLAFEIPLLQIGALSNHGPERDAPVPLDCDLRLPGIVNAGRLSGTLGLFAAQRALELALDLRGIEAALLAPLSRPYGLEPTWRAASLVAKLSATATEASDGTWSGSASLHDVTLSDAEELLALASAGVRSFAIDPAGQRVELTGLELRGTRCTVSRDRDLALHCLGLKTLPAASTQSPPASVPSPAPSGPPRDARPWTVTLADVEASATSLRFVDAATPDSEALELTTLHAQVRALRHPPLPATRTPFALQLAARGIVESLVLDGTLTTGSTHQDLDVEGRMVGTTLHFEPLRPWLAPLGLEPELANGSVSARFAAATRAQQGELRVDCALHDMRFRDGERELLSLAKAEVKGGRLTPEESSIAAITIAGGNITVARSTNGATHLLGLATTASRPVPAELPASRPMPASSPTSQPILPFRLDELTVTDVGARWDDASTRSAVSLAPVVSGRMRDLVVGKRAAPAQFELNCKVPGELQLATLRGSLLPDPTDLRVQATLDCTGLAPVQLAAYLPPHVVPELVDATAHVELMLHATRHAEGGHALGFELANAHLANANSASSLLTLEQLVVRADRIDPKQQVFAIAALTSKGLVLPVVLDRDQVTHVAGFRVAQPVPPPLGADQVATRAPDGNADGPNLRTMPIPRISLGSLDLGLGPITIHDRSTSEDTSPLVIAARATTPAPVVLLAPGWEHQPLPVTIRIEALPVLRELVAELRLDPFAREPRLALDIEGSGLSSAGLLAALPSLRERLAARELTNGTFGLAFATSADWSRKHPLDFAMAGGFGGEIDLTRCELRAAKDGPVLLGLDSLTIDAKRISPVSGDVHLKSFEVRRPVATITQEADGLHVGGVLLRTPTAPIQKPPPVAQPRDVPAAPRPPELRIDDLVVSGLDLELADATTTPPTRMPLSGLDVEVARFSTRAFTEPIPLRFSAALLGGKLPLVARPREPLVRPFLEELSVKGALTLAGAPSGWAKLDVSGLELATFKPLAARAGMKLEDGVLDAGLRLTLLGDQGAELDLRSVFRSLSLSEPANGVLHRLLKLPASLDTVLFALQNQDKEIKIPLGFTLDAQGISTSEITRVAITTLSTLIARAVAAAPLRVTGALGDVVGLTGDATKPKSAVVRYPFAEAALEAKALEPLEPLIQRLLAEPELTLILQHEFGAAEGARFEELANPSPAAAQQDIATLRQRRAELQRQLDLVSAEARVEVGSGSVLGATATRDRLAAIAGEIAATEAALDRLALLLRPDAARTMPRRTREAGVEVAEQRLAELRDALIRELAGRGITNSSLRIDPRRPRWESATSEPRGRVVATLRRRSS